MGAQSTISFADLYGSVAPARGRTEPTDTEKASGNTGTVNTAKPASIWVAMVIMLVIARVLWEKGS